MAQDNVDATVPCNEPRPRRLSLEVLNCEMPERHRKDRGKRVLRTLLNRLRLRRSASVNISEPDPSFKVAYLGNVVTGWAKGDGCVEKPLATLWRNYTQSSRSDVCMVLTVGGGGLKATTKDHGLTEYWANRLTFCAAPSHFPRIFCWVYRHEGKRLRHELRCHAVLCSSSTIANQIEQNLKHTLSLALAEFKKDKVSRQNARLSLVNSIYDNPTMPRRKILLSTGPNNYRPPLERSKSAPKLVSIEENVEEEEESTEVQPSNHPRKKVLRPYDSSSALLDKNFRYNKTKLTQFKVLNETVSNKICDSHAEENAIDKRKVTFSNEHDDGFDKKLTVDEKSNLILAALAEDALSAELESCNERTWFGNLRIATNFVTIDSDEGSLSSGCESASTVTSDVEQAAFGTIEEIQEDVLNGEHVENRESDFKVGGLVLSRGRSLEKLPGADFAKFYGLNNSLSTSNIINDEVSLVPVGESYADFSSLKVYKKRSYSDSGLNLNTCSADAHGDEEENVHDEGYDEVIDCTSSVANIILV